MPVKIEHHIIRIFSAAPRCRFIHIAPEAIETIVTSGAELQLYSVNAVTSGTDSQGEVTVRLKKNGRIVNGAGADTDIVVASAKAYINALNKLHSKMERLNPQV